MNDASFRQGNSPTWRTHNKVDTQDRFEPTLIGRAVGIGSLMPKSPGPPFVERTIKENSGK